MKKIISILACVCILLSAMVITASAAEATNIVLTTDSLALDAYNTEAVSGTVDGVEFTWIQLGCYDGNGIQVRDKDGKTSSFWNTTAFSAPIKEIKLVFSANKSTYDNPNAEIFSFGNAVDSYTYSTKLSTTAGVKEYTITPDAETYTYLHFEHDLSYTMYWDSITIVLADGEGDVTPPADDEEEVTPPAEVAPTYELVDEVVAGTAYKFGMVQANVSETDVYYLAGGMSGYYMATTTDATAAIDVFVEETEGGYYLYTMVDDVKTYINMVVSGTYVNGAYEAEAATVYTFDAEAKTFIAMIDDTPYWFGTRNDKTYTTVGPCKTEYEGFYNQFYAEVVVEEEPETPADPPAAPPAAPSEPATPDAPTVEEKPNTDNKPTSPATGDSIGAVVAMAVAAATVLVASKKR